jgi:hypothetical protein
VNEFKSFKEIPQLPDKPAKPVINRDKVRLYRGKPKEMIVNSKDINWKPIDQVAARVVAPASWYCEPPQPEPYFEMKQHTPERVTPAKIQTHSKLDPETGALAHDFIDMNEAAPHVVDAHTRSVKDGIKAAEQLKTKAQEAVDAIDYLVTQIGGPWKEYEGFVTQALSRVREQRIALSGETRLLMGALREVRQFFLEESYEKEISRLHEFVDLCERLKALKESGFIDAVADTILKL